MSRTYYVIFSYPDASGRWVKFAEITEGIGDLDTLADFKELIESLKATHSPHVIIDSWRLLSERPAILDAEPNTQKAISEAVSAIYFADNSDYLSYLWAVVRALSPAAASMLEDDPAKAYSQFTLAGMAENGEECHE